MNQHFILQHINIDNEQGVEHIQVQGQFKANPFHISQQAEGALQAWVNNLNSEYQSDIEIVDLTQYSQVKGVGSQAIAIIEANKAGKRRFAVGIDKDSAKAPILASCALID